MKGFSGQDEGDAAREEQKEGRRPISHETKQNYGEKRKERAGTVRTDHLWLEGTKNQVKDS